MPTVRLLPAGLAPGPWNMAADEALLAGAAAGGAALRFYGWTEPTLSLGYFQPAGPARALPDLDSLAWVRRPTGGAALVHHHELTYALALPPGRAWQPLGRSWLVRMHDIVRVALEGFGITSRLCEREHGRGEVLCFLHHTPGDLLVGDCKVAGSAQRKQRGALLQHGSILLAQSPFTPSLPGLAELTGHTLSATDLAAALLAECSRAMGWQVHPAEWSAADEQVLGDLITSRYTSSAWNERR